MRRTLVFVILLMASISFAQQKEDPGLTDFPLPAWPANGVIPPDLRDRYVFIDLLRGEYVLAFPDNLGTPAFKKDPGQLETRRFQLQRNVEPAVSVAITTSAPSKYKYEYTITNGSASKNWIDQWNIVLPEQGGSATIAQPTNWLSFMQTGRAFTVKNPNWIRTGSSVFWFNGKASGSVVVGEAQPEGAILPGTSKGGFVLETELRPGFTVAYFRRSVGIGGPDPGYPLEVRKQVEPLLRLEYNSRTVLTIGPKFDKNSHSFMIVSDFVEGISVLTRTGALDANSQFVKTTLNELNQYIAAVRAENRELDKVTGPPITLTAQPRTPVESEVLRALKVSLSLD